MLRERKKKGKCFLLLGVYGRFLNSKTVIRPTTIMATNKPMVAGTKYRSAADCGAVVGCAVAAGAESTTKALWL